MRPSPRRALPAAALAAAALGLTPASATAGPLLPALEIAPAPAGAAQSRLATGPRGTVAHAYAIGNDLRVAVKAPDAPLTSASPYGFSAPQSLGGPQTIVGLSVSGEGVVTLITSVATAGSELHTLKVRTRSTAGTWSAPATITTDAGPAATVRPVFVAAAGGAAALLTDAGIFERTTPTGAFSAVPDTADLNALAGNARGDLAATFVDDGTVHVRRKPAGGSWSATTSLGAAATYPHDPFSNATLAAVAVADDGKVVVGWTTRNAAGNVALVSRTFLPASGWAPLATSATHTNATDGNYDLTLWADAPGRVRAFWYEPAGWPNRFKEQALPGGQPVTPSTPMPTYEPGRAYDPASGRGLAAGQFIANPTGVDLFARAGANSAVSKLRVASNGVAADGRRIGYGPAALAIDDEGNGWLTVSKSIFRIPADPGNDPDRPQDSLLLVGYDPVAPRIESVRIPASADANAPITFSALASDRLSTVSYAWSFGDGQTAAGDSPAHRYAAPGTYAVKVTATDGAGNSASRSSELVVAPAAPQPVRANPKLWTPSYAAGRTTVRTLELSDVRRGDAVKVRCDGPGCTIDAFKSFTVQDGTAKLITRFADPDGLSLGTGATLKVTVSRGGWQSQVAKFTMQAGRGPAVAIWHE